jgi:hypothetical protein
MSDDNGLSALAAALHREWLLRPHRLPEAAAILGERGVFLPNGLRSVEIYNHWAVQLDDQAATIATLRAALDGLVEAAEAYITALDADLYRPGTPEDWWNREAALAALRAALEAER